MPSKKPALKAEDKEELKARQAAEAASKRSSNKSKKGGDQNLNVIIGVGVFICLLAVLLAMSPDRRKQKADDVYVNDYGKVSDATADADGNFTAAASPFFNRWTLGDAKHGLSGNFLTNMIGISGALQACDSDDSLEGGTLPPSYDARENHASCFPEVRDSGNCSASYAIAAAEAISARYCIADNAKYGSVRLSPQQILSCDKKSQGCKGGGIDSVWSYIQRRGLYSEECLPYKGKDGSQCKTDCKEEQKFKVLDHCVLRSEKAVKREIYNRGPAVMPLYLKQEYLLYSSGIYTPTPKSELLYGPDSKAVHHAVVVLGWGKSQGQSYWLVRHSWGSSWGENGYARIAVDAPTARDNYVMTGTIATEENIKEHEKKKAEDEKRKEELKAERAARDARIKEKQQQRQAEEAAKKDAADMKEAEDPEFDTEVDLDNAKE